MGSGNPLSVGPRVDAGPPRRPARRKSKCKRRSSNTDRQLNARLLGRVACSELGARTETAQALLTGATSKLTAAGEGAVAVHVVLPKCAGGALSVRDAVTSAPLVAIDPNKLIAAPASKSLRRLLAARPGDGYVYVLHFASSGYVRFLLGLGTGTRDPRGAGTPPPERATASATHAGVENHRALQDASRKYHDAMSAIAALDAFLVRVSPDTDDDSDDEGCAGSHMTVTTSFSTPAATEPTLSLTSNPGQVRAIFRIPPPPPVSSTHGDRQLALLLQDLDKLAAAPATSRAPTFKTCADGMRRLSLTFDSAW